MGIGNLVSKSSLLTTIEFYPHCTSCYTGNGINLTLQNRDVKAFGQLRQQSQFWSTCVDNKAIYMTLLSTALASKAYFLWT